MFYNYYKKYKHSELGWSDFLYCTHDLEIWDWTDYDYEVYIYSIRV